MEELYIRIANEADRTAVAIALIKNVHCQFRETKGRERKKCKRYRLQREIKGDLQQWKRG